MSSHINVNGFLVVGFGQSLTVLCAAVVIVADVLVSVTGWGRLVVVGGVDCDAGPSVIIVNGAKVDDGTVGSAADGTGVVVGVFAVDGAFGSAVDGADAVVGSVVVGVFAVDGAVGSAVAGAIVVDGVVASDGVVAADAVVGSGVVDGAVG